MIVYLTLLFFGTLLIPPNDLIDIGVKIYQLVKNGCCVERQSDSANYTAVSSAHELGFCHLPVYPVGLKGKPTSLLSGSGEFES